MTLFFSDVPWGELFKLTNCVKHIIRQTDEKSRAPAVLKDLLVGFLRMQPRAEGRQGRQPRLRDNDPPTRVLSMLVPHGGQKRPANTHDVRAKMCQGPGPRARGPRGHLPPGAEWWRGQHPCCSTGPSSAMHGHSVRLRGSL